jgi:hypothetical protein
MVDERFYGGEDVSLHDEAPKNNNYPELEFSSDDPGLEARSNRNGRYGGRT